MNIFFKDEDYEYYKKVLYEQSQIYDLEIISYGLMTNHVHLIVIPKIKKSLSKMIGETHRLYTRKINFEQKVKGHLFQSRFYSTSLDETHLLNAIKYVELNPVKVKMVGYSWDYKYSSVLHRLNYVTDEILSYYEVLDNIKNYKNFLLEQEHYNNVREKIRTGKPCGDLEFYGKIKEITGVDYLPKKRGPKVRGNEDK